MVIKIIFQMGTVVDEGTDFYSSRLTKKQRKQTLVEELMADANIRQYVGLSLSNLILFNVYKSCLFRFN